MSKKKKTKKYPDGRGKRPHDPNEFAAWLVEQTTKSKEVPRNDSANADFDNK